jgi:exodeoxyribonuclease-5
MDWSSKQQAALASVARWLKEPGTNKVFRLFGYAGTGKTTLARHFAEGCGGLVLFAAFTGKAASVMRANGCHNANTIHRLIYKPAPKSEQRLLELRGHLAELKAEDPVNEQAVANTLQEMRDIEQDLKQPAFTLNFESDVRHASLVVIDECSMVDGRMADDLMSFGTPILVLGDPMQLPPVGGAGYFTNAEPDVMLTEIHRQAQDSPIIRLATEVREGGWLRPGSYGDSLVVDRSDLDRESVMLYDQILVGRNNTRRMSNARAREILKREGPLPVSGDKLVCLRNDHQIGLLNGELWTTIESTVLDNDTLSVSLRNEEDQRPMACMVHRHHFEGRELGYWEKRQAQEFDYGYALTTHKAQGSQWPQVIVFDESGCFRQDRKRWLYTAITRAAQRVAVVTGL